MPLTVARSDPLRQGGSTSLVGMVARDDSTAGGAGGSESNRSEWMTGPTLPDGVWQGQRLGLPESGPGSIASILRRAGGIAIDWAIALMAANLIVDADVLLMNIAIQASFFVLYLLCVWLLGRTPGHWIMGIGVIDVASRGTLASTGPVGALRALLRTVLVCLIIPIVIMDPDSRGLHDKASGTVVVRTR